MAQRRLTSSLAFVASGALITGAGLALTAVPATAATPTHHDAHRHPQAAGVKPLTGAQLQQVRTRQSRMLEQSRTAPAFRKAAAKTFTVNTTQDTSLANPAGTRCLDAGGKCSLRAAVDAANNLKAPVRIVLGKRTYTLSSATELTVTNPAGTSIDDVAKRLSAIPEVYYLIMVLGRFDLSIATYHKSQDDYRDFLTTHFYGQPDIAGIENSLVLKVHKMKLQWDLNG